MKNFLLVWDQSDNNRWNRSSQPQVMTVIITLRGTTVTECFVSKVKVHRLVSRRGKAPSEPQEVSRNLRGLVATRETLWQRLWWPRSRSIQNDLQFITINYEKMLKFECKSLNTQITFLFHTCWLRAKYIHNRLLLTLSFIPKFRHLHSRYLLMNFG